MFYVGGTVAAMSEQQPADAVMFPELDDEQLAIVLALGERRPVREGEVLFSPADDHYDWIVILSGLVEVLGPNGELITRHGARRFLGEVSLVTRQRPYLSTRVAEAGEVVVVPADVFRSQVLTDVRLSDTVLEAFLARRAALLSRPPTRCRSSGPSTRRRRWRCASTPPATGSPTTGSTPTPTPTSPPCSTASASPPPTCRSSSPSAACSSGPRPAISPSSSA